MLFFGCRSQLKDFYCADEFRSLMDTGHLQMFTAFSRDQVLILFVSYINAFTSEPYVFVCACFCMLNTDIFYLYWNVLLLKSRFSEDCVLMSATGFMHCAKILL